MAHEPGARPLCQPSLQIVEDKLGKRFLNPARVQRASGRWAGQAELPCIKPGHAVSWSRALTSGRDLAPHGLALLPQDLGAAAGSKRPTCVIMIKPHEDYQETYDECLEEVSALPLPL